MTYDLWQFQISRMIQSSITHSRDSQFNNQSINSNKLTLTLTDKNDATWHDWLTHVTALQQWKSDSRPLSWPVFSTAISGTSVTTPISGPISWSFFSSGNFSSAPDARRIPMEIWKGDHKASNHVKLKPNQKQKTGPKGPIGPKVLKFLKLSLKKIIKF